MKSKIMRARRSQVWAKTSANPFSRKLCAKNCRPASSAKARAKSAGSTPAAANTVPAATGRENTGKGVHSTGRPKAIASCSLSGEKKKALR